MHLKIVNDHDSNPAGAFSDARERKIIFLLCLIAAVHVFIFSAAFPFFNNVDEQIHLDLAVKYSQGHVPRSLEKISPETQPYAVIYGTHEYLWPSNYFPSERFPPAWALPVEKTAPMLLSAETQWAQVVNHEASQPPLYYTLAGLWWRIGKICGLDGGHLLYWLRFLDLFFVTALVWLGYFAARIIFPENLFLRLGVPALLAFFPQTAFYAIQNDVLSPLCFGAAFILIMKFLRAEIPSVRLGIFTGLALAATFLTKISNLPLLAVSGIFIALKIFQQARNGKLRQSLFPLASLFYCAALPVAAWLAWCKYNFGDFTGTAEKIRFLGWTHKPFAEWWHHPIFTPHGFWTFLCDHADATGRVKETGILTTFWQGEILWHRQPLTLASVDLVYVVLTFVLCGAAFLKLLSKSKTENSQQREALWFGLACFIAAIAFSGFLSIIYDFHDCFYPSREHPYFTSGRLMLGVLIPFSLVFIYGLDVLLKKCGNTAKFFALAGIILFMLVSEITTDWRIFPNAYNWFHM